MASQLTDDLILSHRLIKRRYVQIPKDQKAHLDDNAWSENLSHGQHPMLNIPASVLQDVKDLHTRKLAKSTEPSASSSNRPPSSRSSGLPPRLSSHDVPASSPQQDDDNEPFPWSQSPVHHLRAQNDYQLPSSSAHQPSSPNKSPLKRKDPPQFINDVPQSSSVNSVGLEIEAPGFVSQVIEPPVNRAAMRVIATDSAKPEPTPPSAQLPIATGERGSQPSAAKRRRVVDDIHDQGNVSPSSAPVVTIIPSQRPNTSNQNSLTTTTSASSAPLSTHIARGSTNKSSEPKIMSDPAPIRSFTPTYEGRRQATAARHLVVAGTPTPGTSYAPPPAQQHASAKAPSNTPKPSQQSRQSSQASPSVSFETFKRAYPGYSRSSRDFTTALLMVKTRRCDRILHEILYDDFIRAYTTEYFAYVSECSRKKIRNILRDIEWYNENVQDVLYTKKVVRKDNLGAFLAAHAAEAESIRRSLPSSEETESTVESDEDMDDAPDSSEGHEPEVIELDRESEIQASPELHIESPGPVQASSQRRSQVPLQVNSPTGTAHAVESLGQMNKHKQDPASGEDAQEPHIEEATPADTSRLSPELHTESPRAAKVTVAVEGHHATEAHSLTTPGSAKSFASQDVSREFLGEILPSSAGSLNPTSSRKHADIQQQGAPIVSPSHRAARTGASRGSRNLLAVDEDSDDEDGFDPPLPPTRSAATPSSSKRSHAVPVGRNADGNKVAHRSSLPTAGAPLSVTGPTRSSVDEEKEEEEEEEEDAAFQNDVLEAQPPRKVTQSTQAPKETPRPLTAAERRTTTPQIPASTAPKPPAPVSSSAMGPPRLDGRVPKGSTVILGAERRHSAGSSIASSTNGPRSKKRVSETPEQRTQRLKAFMEAQMEKKKRLSSGTPSSTFASGK